MCVYHQARTDLSGSIHLPIFVFSFQRAHSPRQESGVSKLVSRESNLELLHLDRIGRSESAGRKYKKVQVTNWQYPGRMRIP
jgi:hypothetical protein